MLQAPLHRLRFTHARACITQHAHARTQVHAGNGTQQIHYSDPRVLVVSLHRRDAGFYPADCGAADEIGAGAGRGFNINVPWSSKGMGDGDYLAAFDLLLAPVLRQFAPQLVLVSAGAHRRAGRRRHGLALVRVRASPAACPALVNSCARAADAGVRPLVLTRAGRL